MLFFQSKNQSLLESSSLTTIQAAYDPHALWRMKLHNVFLQSIMKPTVGLVEFKVEDFGCVSL